jgi:hypothetical protein
MDVHLPIAGMSVNLLLRLGPGGALGSLSGMPGIVAATVPIVAAAGAKVGAGPILAPGDLDTGDAGGCPQ